MAGAVVVIVFMLLVLPPLLFLGGAVISAALGWLLVDDTDATHPDSPYRELNR